MAKRNVKFPPNSHAQKMSERDKIFIEMIEMLWQYTDEGLKQIAYDADVHWGTLYSWKSAHTMKPRIDTLCKVAKVLGFEIVLQAKGKPKKKLRAMRVQ
jgi:DNA-binding phage protein